MFVKEICELEQGVTGYEDKKLRKQDLRSPVWQNWQVPSERADSRADRYCKSKGIEGHIGAMRIYPILIHRFPPKKPGKAQSLISTTQYGTPKH